MITAKKHRHASKKEQGKVRKMSTKPLEIPPQFSNLMGLGKPLEVFKSKVSLVARIIVIVIFALGGSGALLYALYILWQRWGRYYPPVIFQTMLPYLIGTVIAFGIAALTIWDLINRRKKAVVVYNNGLAYSDRKGVKTWRWEQINDVYANVVHHYTNGIFTGTTHVYTLHHADGKKLVLNDSIAEVESLYNFIQNHSLQLRYQKLANAYNAGHAVAFGPVVISKQGGLQIGKKVYTWNEIEQVGINKGVLAVKKKNGGWFSGASATASAIPNLHVLLSILDQVIGLQVGR
jgi:hypothetical protein